MCEPVAQGVTAAFLFIPHSVVEMPWSVISISFIFLAVLSLLAYLPVKPGLSYLPLRSFCFVMCASAGVPSGFTKTLVAASKFYSLSFSRGEIAYLLQLQFEFTLIFDGSLEFLVVFSDSLSVSESLISAKLVF